MSMELFVFSTTPQVHYS